MFIRSQYGFIFYVSIWKPVVYTSIIRDSNYHIILITMLLLHFHLTDVNKNNIKKNRCLMYISDEFVSLNYFSLMPLKDFQKYLKQSNTVK